MTDEREMRERVRAEWKRQLLKNVPDLREHEVEKLMDDASGDIEEWAAFVAAERDAERERCCRDVCEYCSNPSKWSAVFKEGEHWIHQANLHMGVVEVDCEAAAIRSRVAAKGVKA